MIQVYEVLTALASQRPVFCSEADFQHAFAWEIHCRLRDALVRLERPILLPHSNRQIYLDIWATQGDAVFAVELKYKTCELEVQCNDVPFKLKNQSAQDIGRYDFIRDIQRLEQVTAAYKRATGCAILLTNDRSYWTLPRSNNSVDKDFRLQEGRILRGNLRWTGASTGTMRHREEPLTLKGSYCVQWQDYSPPQTASYYGFRYLLITVGPRNN